MHLTRHCRSGTAFGPPFVAPSLRRAVALPSMFQRGRRDESARIRLHAHSPQAARSTTPIHTDEGRGMSTTAVSPTATVISVNKTVK